MSGPHRCLQTRRMQRMPIKLMLSDHEEIGRLLLEFDRAWESRIQLSAAEAVLEALAIHFSLAEEVFYPEIRRKAPEAGWMKPIEHTHRAVKVMICELESISEFGERYEGCFRRLASHVWEHLHLEEAVLLTEAVKLDIDWTRLSRRLTRVRKKLLGQLRHSHLETVMAGDGPDW